MADARADILAKVRKQLGVRGDEPGRRGAVHARLREAKSNLVPERAQKPRAERLKLFQSMLETNGAVVTRVRAWKALPEAIAALLRDRNLPSRIRVGEDETFDSLKADPGLLEVLTGPAAGADQVSASRAFAGASETGTLFFASGPANPSTLNFLPENHIAIVAAEDITGSFEDAWAKLRARYGEGEMPRTVNLIGGPSRTADIEQTIVLGAHGPRAFFVFIVGT